MSYAVGQTSSGGSSSGGLTDAQLRASAVPVDVSDRAGRLVGHVVVDTAPTTAVTGPLTDTQLRATAVPVSNVSLPLPSGAAKDSTLTDGTQRVGGTVAVSSATLATEATLAALSAKTAGDTTNGSVVQSRADATTTGNITASGQSVTAAVVAGMAGWSMYAAGTYSTGSSLVMEASYDSGATYIVLRMLAINASTLGYVLTIASGANTALGYVADIPAGATHVRARCTTWSAPTGTINLVIGQALQRFASPVVPTSVSITSVTPGTGTTSLGKAEDAAHTSGDTGVAAWGVRNDALAAFTNADGDYSPLATDSRGALMTSPATFAYSHIAAVATTTVKSGGGQLRAVTINAKGTVASTVTIYDNTTGAGTIIAIIDSLTLSGTFMFDAVFATGLTLVTTGTVAPDVTVSYR